jgi:hypothetical protein
VVKADHTIRRPAPPKEHTPRPGTQQFNATPRFTFSSTPRPTPSQNLPGATLAPTRYLTPAGKVSKKDLDAIDISSDDFPCDVHESIETDEAGYNSGDLDEGESSERRSPKRRRLSNSPPSEEEEKGYDQGDLDMRDNPPPPSPSSSLPILSSPPAARRLVSNTAPRFLLSTPAPHSTPQSSLAAPSTHTFLKPPRFRPPDPSEQAQERGDPLPEQFSPHRKGQKYVPGGLAVEMRDWLMNIESAVPAPRQREKAKGDPLLVKLLIDEVSGNARAGLVLARGRQVHNMDEHTVTTDTIGTMKVILAGEGSITGLQKASPVEAGKIIGIKRPVWEVVVEGEKWGVGVDWKVLA